MIRDPVSPSPAKQQQPRINTKWLCAFQKQKLTFSVGTRELGGLTGDKLVGDKLVGDSLAIGGRGVLFCGKGPLPPMVISEWSTFWLAIIFDPCTRGYDHETRVRVHCWCQLIGCKMKNRHLEGRNSTLKLLFDGINLPRRGRKTSGHPFLYAMGYKYNKKIDP
jgi:hypothetical protein